MAAPALKTVPKGSLLERKWKADEIRQLLAALRSHLALGKDDYAVAQEMKLTTAEYNALKREMYAQDKINVHSKSVEEVYTDYCLRQEQNITDLANLVNELKTTKQYNAVVGAIRAKSDILDKTIKLGQEFGLLEKVPEKKQVVAGVMVAGLETEELRALVQKLAADVGGLALRYGDADFMSAKPAPLLTAGTSAPTPAPASAAVVPAAVKPVAAYPKPSLPTFGGKGKPARTAAGPAKAAGPKAARAAERKLNLEAMKAAREAARTV